jgi:hypothetical protein
MDRLHFSPRNAARSIGFGFPRTFPTTINLSGSPPQFRDRAVEWTGNPFPQVFHGNCRIFLHCVRAAQSVVIKPNRHPGAISRVR